MCWLQTRRWCGCGWAARWRPATSRRGTTCTSSATCEPTRPPGSCPGCTTSVLPYFASLPAERCSTALVTRSSISGSPIRRTRIAFLSYLFISMCYYKPNIIPCINCEFHDLWHNNDVARVGRQNNTSSAVQAAGGASSDRGAERAE